MARATTPPKARTPKAKQPAPGPHGLAIGTELTRSYKGRTDTLTVTANGFLLNGTAYRSLSAAARAITGSNWNGHVFWGLKQRGAQA